MAFKYLSHIDHLFLFPDTTTSPALYVLIFSSLIFFIPILAAIFFTEASSSIAEETVEKRANTFFTFIFYITSFLLVLCIINVWIAIILTFPLISFHYFLIKYRVSNRLTFMTITASIILYFLILFLIAFKPATSFQALKLFNFIEYIPIEPKT